MCVCVCVCVCVCEDLVVGTESKYCFKKRVHGIKNVLK